MTAYLYILEDTKGRFYVGSTKDINKRMNQHKNGHTQTTRNMSEPSLVFSQKYDTLREARESERRIKKLKRKDYIRKIIEDGFVKVK